MKLISHILLTLLAINMFFSCVKNPMEEQLKKAENLMDLHPDSSLKILQTMNIEYGCPDLISARYALALAKARDKNYIFSKDDSLLRKGIVGFEKHGDKTGAMWSHFYIGVCHYNAAEYRAAQSEALTASDLAGELENEYACGKISELIADIYQHSYNYKKSAEYRSRAIIHYLNSRKNEFARYASVDLANTCVKNGDTSRARHILDSIGAAINPDERYFNVYLQASYIPLLMKEERNDEARDAYDKLGSMVGEDIYSFVDLTLLAKLFIISGETSNIRDMIDVLDKMDPSAYDEESYHRAKGMCYRYIGGYISAIEENAKSDSIHNEKLSLSLNDNLADAMQDHKDEIIEESVSSGHTMGKLFYIALSLLFILIIIMYVAYKILKIERVKKVEEQMLIAKGLESQVMEEREKNGLLTSENDSIKNEFIEKTGKLKKEIEEKNEHLRELNNENSDMQTVLDKLKQEIGVNAQNDSADRQRLRNLLNSSFDILSEFANAYFKSDTNKKYSPYFRDAFEKNLKKFRSEEFQNNLIACVDRCYDNIITEFRKEFPKIDKKYIVLLTYLVLKLTTKEICLLMDLKQTYYYTLRRRLKDNISKSTGDNRERFSNAIASDKE